MNGASLGPAPDAQARASNWRLTRSSWRTWPHRKLRKKVPRVDGALTVTPRVQAVPPVRNASASSIQSPPARAEATSVISLSPVLARPRGAAQVQVLLNQLRQAQTPGQGGGKHQPGIGHQAMVRRRRLGCGRGGYVVASKRCSFSGIGFLFQNHYPRYKGAPSYPLKPSATPIPSVDSGLACARLMVRQTHHEEILRHPHDSCPFPTHAHPSYHTTYKLFQDLSQHPTRHSRAGGNLYALVSDVGKSARLVGFEIVSYLDFVHSTDVRHM